MVLGVSTGAAIGDRNPEVAMESAWSDDQSNEFGVSPRVCTRKNGDLQCSGGKRRLEMPMHKYLEAMREGRLPADTYSFVKVEGTQIAADFGTPMRELFVSVLANQDPELARLTESLPELADLVANVSTRLAFGGPSTGSSWHGHGAAMLGVVAGKKSWFVRDPARSLPSWLDDTLRGAEPGQSTREWLDIVAGARGQKGQGGGAKQDRRDKRGADPRLYASLKEHMWHCTQSAGQIMFVPAGLKHAILNEAETLAW
jgi:hypothetical protein